MRGKRATTEQIIAVLKEVEAGRSWGVEKSALTRHLGTCGRRIVCSAKRPPIPGAYAADLSPDDGDVHAAPDSYWRLSLAHMRSHSALFGLLVVACYTLPCLA
jgi:hypothetical protein